MPRIIGKEEGEGVRGSGNGGRCIVYNVVYMRKHDEGIHEGMCLTIICEDWRARRELLTPSK